MKSLLLCLALLLQLKGGEHDKLSELAGRWEIPQSKPDSKLIKIWAYHNDVGAFYNLGFVEPDDSGHALALSRYLRLQPQLATHSHKGLKRLIKMVAGMRCRDLGANAGPTLRDDGEEEADGVDLLF